MDSLIPADQTLAVTRGWGSLVTSGILVGVAGYIVGTPLDLLIYSWW